MNQISKYMNLSRKDIWDAIQNQSDDNLDEDVDHCIGICGDVINTVEDSPPNVEPEVIEGQSEEAENLEIDEVDAILIGDMSISGKHHW